MEELKQKLFEALGAASMCWAETPKSGFDSSKCANIGEELWKEIEGRFKSLEQKAEKLDKIKAICDNTYFDENGNERESDDEYNLCSLGEAVAQEMGYL